MEQIEKRHGYNADSRMKAELRNEDGKKYVIRGYPIVFNLWNKQSDWFEPYEEVILPKALDKTDISEVYLLGGHNPDNLLGRVGRNMRIEKDENGLFFECELPNTQLARDYYQLIESGILDGMSFAFNTPNEVKREANGYKRVVDNITKIYEISLTPFPAYQEASVVASRTNDNKAETPLEDSKFEKVAETPKPEVDNAKLDELLKQIKEA